jgi:hypothetical protein
MKNLSMNQKVFLVSVIGTFISFFLPYFPTGNSLMDIADTKVMLWAIPVFAIISALLSYKGKNKEAAVAFSFLTGIWLAFNFLSSWSWGIEFFKETNIGGYLLFASLTIGMIFVIKESYKKSG